MAEDTDGSFCRQAIVPSSRMDRRSIASLQSRRLSQTSSLAALEHERQHYAQMTTASQNKWRQMGKMISVILLPVITLVVVSITALVGSIQVKQDSLDAQVAITDYLLLDNVVTNLQIERGKTTSYLSSAGANLQAWDELLVLRNTTDRSIDAVLRWPNSPALDWPTLQSFVDELTSFRSKVYDVLVSTDDAVAFYAWTNIELMDAATAGLLLPEEGTMWKMVVATSSLLRASEVVGIQRALCAPYFTVCNFTVDQELYLTRLLSQEQTMLQVAFSFNPNAGAAYTQLHVGTVLEDAIAEHRRNMRSHEYRQLCATFPDEVRFTNTLFWFDNITSYIYRIKTVRDNITNAVLQSFHDVDQTATTQLSLYSLVMILVTLCSLALSTWYAARLYGMITRMASYALRISRQTHELAKEMKKADLLLSQMLPKAISDKLKAGEEVEAEYFVKSTIFFSDIVGFTSLSASSSPMQVVELLNSLYSTFDALIDKRDAYKLMTIGDAYMIVSGVPHATPVHAAEIAHLSLDLIVAIENFVIPHMPSRKLQVRIGAHSGSCVAGVVGIKMPRYCLFGDAVTIASKMESGGVPQRIHITEMTQKELEDIGGFQMSYRRTIEVMGTPRKTFFLDSYDESQGRKSAIRFNVRDQN